MQTGKVSFKFQTNTKRSLENKTGCFFLFGLVFVYFCQRESWKKNCRLFCQVCKVKRKKRDNLVKSFTSLHKTLLNTGERKSHVSSLNLHGLKSSDSEHIDVVLMNNVMFLAHLNKTIVLSFLHWNLFLFFRINGRNQLIFRNSRKYSKNICK